MGKTPTDWGPRAEQDSLWRDYRQAPTDQARNALVVHYQGWLRNQVARFLARRSGIPVDADELMSAAQDGLICSIPRFQPERQVRFTTFAATRVRFAMVDYLRSIDPVGRGRRLRERGRNEAVSRLTQVLGRSPTAEEIAAELARLKLIDETCPSTYSYHAEGPDQRDDFTKRATIEEQLALAAKEQPVGHEEGERLAELLKGVNLQLASIVYHYHVHKHTMKAIGEFYGVGESRISQLYKDAIRQARETLYARQDRL